MLTGLQKLAVQRVQQRASSPKLQVLNTALLSAQSNLSFDDARKDREFWGRLVESAVGAYLINSATGKGLEVFYWRERSKEVDFVLHRNKVLVAIEVKSGANKGNLPGMEELAGYSILNVSYWSEETAFYWKDSSHIPWKNGLINLPIKKYTNCHKETINPARRKTWMR